MRSVAALTIDLDVFSCYAAIHGLEDAPAEGADPTYSVGVRRALALFDEFDAPATLFCVGRDLAEPEHAAIIARAHRDDHEIASHSFGHAYDLRLHSADAIDGDFARAEDAIERVCGARPVGFRAPGYNLDASLMRRVAAHGYAYDSSIFPSPPYWLAKGGVMAARRLIGEPSRSSVTPARNLLAPLAPYRPDLAAPHRRARRPEPGAPWEFPMAVLPGVRFPVIGTSLHLLRARGVRAALGALGAASPGLLQLEFHAVDFMDARDPGAARFVTVQPDLRIPWTRKARRYRAILRAIAERHEFSTLRAVAASLNASGAPS